MDNPVLNPEQVEFPTTLIMWYFLKAWKEGRISGYFDTKYMAVLQIEPILHNFEDQKIANIFNPELVNFCVTLVNMCYIVYTYWEFGNTDEDF